MAVRRPRRRLLFLSPVMPSDRGNGLAIRAGFFLDAYAREFDIDLAVIPIVSAPLSCAAFVRRRVARLELLPLPGLDSHLALVMAIKDPAARLAAFRRYGRPSLAGFAHEPLRELLSDRLAREVYDVVHVSRLYLGGLAQACGATRTSKRPRLVIDCDENDCEAYRRIATIEKTGGCDQRAAWAEAEAEAFAKLASDVLPDFELGFAASTCEAKSIADRMLKVLAIPNVLPRPLRLRARARNPTKTVIFVGSMGYAPNDDAARWLLTEIWPRLHRLLPHSLRLVIVGSNPGTTVIRLARRPEVTVTGTVPDVGNFYRRADLAVVPIRAGGGTRLKIMEAAAWRVPMVSTSFGVSGTTFRAGQELLIADGADKFARSCAAVLQSTVVADRLANAAWRRLVLDYRYDCWVERVLGAVIELTPSRCSEQGRSQSNVGHFGTS